jgi:hypothetical protein
VRDRDREVCLCSERVALRVRVEDLLFFLPGVSLGLGLSMEREGDSR